MPKASTILTDNDLITLRLGAVLSLDAEITYLCELALAGDTAARRALETVLA
jgi:hypothetical protein